MSLGSPRPSILVPLTVTLALVAGAILAGPAAGLPVDTEGTVKNKDPKVRNLNVPHTVTPLAGGDRVVEISFVAEDGNGKKDVAGGEVVVFDRDNLTVHGTGSVEAEPVVLDEGEMREFAGTFTMRYWDAPAIGNESYTVRVRVVDEKGSWSAPQWATFHYEPLAALSLSAAAIDFGEVSPGARSAANELTIQNQGNVRIDLDVSGSSLLHDRSALGPDRVRYSLDALFTDEDALTEAPATLAGFDLSPGPSSAKSVWWLLDVPPGSDAYVPAGAYHGSIAIVGLAG